MSQVDPVERRKLEERRYADPVVDVVDEATLMSELESEKALARLRVDNATNNLRDPWELFVHKVVSTADRLGQKVEHEEL